MDRPTREQVLAEPAGRRLDAWTALFVLGYTRRRADRVAEHTDAEAEQPSHLDYCWDWFDAAGTHRFLPSASTNIEPAWRVHRHLCGPRPCDHETVGRYLRGLREQTKDKDGAYNPGLWALVGLADRMPEAICKAALLAVLVETPR